MNQSRHTTTTTIAKSRLDDDDTRRRPAPSFSSSLRPTLGARLNGGQQQPMNLTMCSLAALISVLLLAAALVECQAEEQLTVESRQAKEQAASENELADTLKYLEKLEKLDQYWSEVARPRFGRSYYKQRARPDLLAASRPLRSARSNALNSPLIELINARLAQRYNSNDSF